MTNIESMAAFLNNLIGGIQGTGRSFEQAAEIAKMAFAVDPAKIQVLPDPQRLAQAVAAAQGGRRKTKAKAIGFNVG